MKNILFLALHLSISPLVIAQTTLPGSGYEFEGNGKIKTASPLPLLYTKTDHADGWKEALSGDTQLLTEAIKNQFRYLFLQDPSKTHTLGNFSVENEKLRKTVNKLLEFLKDTASWAAPSFSLYQIKGEDDRGNVHFTAYFTPVLSVSEISDAQYRFPLYKMPGSWKGHLPAREEIDNKGALQNRGLEIAWSKSLLDNFFMQVQGSGYVKYPNGRMQLLANNGSNGQPYTSVGKYLVAGGHVPQELISLESISNWFSQNPDSLENVLFLNRSYTFFAPSDSKPTGASGVALTEGHSIAVDPGYIPFGAVLLARMPVLDETGSLLRHEYRLLTAQDRGGAIKGPGHVDLYAGVGEEALKKASALHHYGQLWLILAD